MSEPNPYALPTSELLDPEQLQMLLEAGASDSGELFREIFGMFEEESLNKMEEIKAFAAEGKSEELSRSAHAIAGSSANVGGREVWLQAKEIENLCKAGRLEEARGRIPTLEETYHSTLKILREFARGLPG